MIDVPLLEAQFSRVLGFLGEQLGDSDVTIVFGDAADGRAYFVSNKVLQGYEKHGNIYVRDSGSPYEWQSTTIQDIEARFLDFPTYDTLKDEKGESRELSPAERILFGIQNPYAWSHSGTFRNMFPIYRRSGIFLEFPDDYAICHEAAHGLTEKHADILVAYPLDGELRTSTWFSKMAPDEFLEEAMAQHVSIDYLDRYHPEHSKRLREFWTFDLDKINEFLLKHNTDLFHVEAFRVATERLQTMEELKAKFRERNQAHKALIS